MNVAEAIKMISEASEKTIGISVSTRTEITELTDFLQSKKAVYSINFDSLKGTTINVEATSELKAALQS